MSRAETTTAATMMVGPSLPAVAWSFAAALLETKAARAAPRASRRGWGHPKRVHLVFRRSTEAGCPPRSQGWSLRPAGSIPTQLAAQRP